MKKHPILYLIIGIIVLIAPTAIYLCFLIPSMSEYYNTLMISSGIIGGSGFYASSIIPKRLKYSNLIKLFVNSFNILTIIVLVQEFIIQLVGLVALFIISFIIFMILKGAWKNGKQRIKNERFAKEITRNIAQTIK